MKVVTQEDVRGYTDATITGGIKGAFIAVGLAVPAHLLLTRRVPIYRTLPLSLRALGYVTLVVPCISISAEKAGEAYNRSGYSGIGQKEIDYELEMEREKWDKMTKYQKAADWAGRHKYGIIGAGWAASMALAFGIVARNPYQTTSQKVVQARMWAQGLTVGLLVGSAMLTGLSAKDNEQPHEVVDHSWKRMLEQDEHLTKEERAQLDGNDTDKHREIHRAVMQRKKVAAGQA
ncbi:hypothetical protein L204_103697 [Cryptococcus depauperatus]|nr:mitochondrial protein [Cryptococcus depauperatus CBS 7855]